jgi:hypothetical protein
MTITYSEIKILATEIATQVKADIIAELSPTEHRKQLFTVKTEIDAMLLDQVRAWNTLSRLLLQGESPAVDPESNPQHRAP